MIAVGVQAPPHVEYHATRPGVSFADAFLAVTNIVFAYSMTPNSSMSLPAGFSNSELVAHVAFFGFISEMKGWKLLYSVPLTLSRVRWAVLILWMSNELQANVVNF